MKKIIIFQFIKFGLVGATSTIIDWGAYFALTRLSHMHYLVAKTISFLLAVMNSYLLNRLWTFAVKKDPTLKEFLKFLTIAFIGLTLNTSIMFLMVGKLGLADIWGLAIATTIVVFWNFTSSRYWVFKASV